MLTKRKILDRFFDALEGLADGGKRELFAQGHRATGRGIDSVEPVITSEDLANLCGAIMANDYLVPVDTGVPASRVAYNRGSGAGTSKLIDGLLAWAQIVKPGLSLKEQTSFVFATVNAAKDGTGFPTSGAFTYSSNGRRTGWIENGIGKRVNDFEEQFRLFDLVANSFEEAIARAEAA